MPTFVSEFEDTSPYFTYSGTAWLANGARQDTNLESSSDATYLATKGANASLSFEYFGSKVSVYGSKRGNHGPFQVMIDGQVRYEGTGFAQEDEFQATLFEATETNGHHTVALINKPSSNGAWIDVDVVSWETTIGLDNEDLIVNIIQDSHPSWTYEPPNAWSKTPAKVGTFSGRSGHSTSSSGASAELTFSGHCIALYGPIGPSYSAYTIQLDGQPSKGYTPFPRPYYRPSQLLFWAGGLNGGNHSLKITKNSLTDEELAIDYAEIYTTPSLGGSFVDLQQHSTVINQTKTPIGFVAALAILSVISLVLLLGHVTLFIRRQARKKSGNTNNSATATLQRTPAGTSMIPVPFFTNEGDTSAEQPSILQKPPCYPPSTNAPRGNTSLQSFQSSPSETLPRQSAPPAYIAI